jgi:hypothetical protein
MAISEAMREANRANARRSTGPRTAAGKAAARLNALKHGLAGRTVVLPGEDDAGFAALEADLAARFEPEGEMEREAVREMATGLWRLGRAPRAEVAALVANADDELFAENPTAAALGAPGAVEILLRVSRYEGQIRRTYERARERLAMLREARAAAPRNVPAARPAPARPAAPTAPKTPAPARRESQFPAGNGFVSSFPLAPPPGPLKQALLGSVSHLAFDPPPPLAPDPGLAGAGPRPTVAIAGRSWPALGLGLPSNSTVLKLTHR